ncbi:hypothetical protein K504DRAFT_351505, partial [Pleomassaria siparia CBS 279.74]
LSNDTMDHTELVMACRFGWTRSPDTGPNISGQLPSIATQPPLTTSTVESRTKRFVPCRGRLYHQLLCSHKIRTDIVEDCGSNCLEPVTNISDVPFYCHECFEKEAANIWTSRELEHNAAYPPMDQMTTEQYNQWYDEHRQLETQYSRDRKVYQLELQAKTRPSHFCSATEEISEEEKHFAAELDSLSLALSPSNDSIVNMSQARTNRVNLPNDESEQLHWGLNALALDRGSCGVEYSASQPSNRIPTIMSAIEEDIWQKPR